jgi:hypothetical protein
METIIELNNARYGILPILTLMQVFNEKGHTSIPFTEQHMEDLQNAITTIENVMTTLQKENNKRICCSFLQNK